VAIPKEALEAYRRERQRAEARRSGRPASSDRAILKLLRKSGNYFATLLRAGGVPEQLQIPVGPELEAFLPSAESLSELDLRSSHFIIMNLIEEVSKAATYLKLPTGADFVFGAHVGSGLIASQLPVVGEHESIIEISNGLIVFLNCVAKWFAELLTYPEENTVQFDPDAAISCYLSNRSVQREWDELIEAFAVRDTVPRWRAPPTPASPIKFKVKTQLLDAMEIYVVAHEFGHHALEHGDFDPDQMSPWQLEFDADAYAHLVSVRVGQADEPINHFTLSGAGATLSLLSMELVQRAKQVLRTGSDKLAPSITHPNFETRIAAIAEMDKFLPEEFQAHHHKTRSLIVEIMERLWVEMRPQFVKLHGEGVRPKADDGGIIGHFVLGFMARETVPNA